MAKKTKSSAAVSPAAQRIYASATKAVAGHSSGINVMKLIDAELAKNSKGGKDLTPELEKAKAEVVGLELELKDARKVIKEAGKENEHLSEELGDAKEKIAELSGEIKALKTPSAPPTE